MEKQSIKVTILADSIERIGNNRMTTWKLTFPRFILAEILTHAMLKNNSASSRAIPFNKMVEQVENDPFIPIKWMKDHKGMQGEEFITDERELESCKRAWLRARNNSLADARNLNHHSLYSTEGKLTNDVNVTKQLCNRLLEPFLWHTIILTGTEFENFFALRAHPMAEIHLQDLAYKMLDVYNASTPKELKEGEWHIPFSDEMNLDKLIELNPDIRAVATLKEIQNVEIQNKYLWLDKVRISTAKCAQVSYMKFGSDDYEDLIDLHDSLLLRPYEGKRGTRDLTDPIHASPASHCAQAMTEIEYFSHIKGVYPTITDAYGIVNYERYPVSYNEDSVGFQGVNDKNPDIYGWCHNLRGFKSYRSMLPNENSSDNRVIKK